MLQEIFTHKWLSVSNDSISLREHIVCMEFIAILSYLIELNIIARHSTGDTIIIVASVASACDIHSDRIIFPTERR